MEGRLWAAAGGLVLCSGLAFLPARWLPLPLWRRELASAPAIVLPGSITAAPGETAFWIGVLALSLLVGLFALSQPVRARGMIWLALRGGAGVRGVRGAGDVRAGDRVALPVFGRGDVRIFAESEPQRDVS